MADTVTDSAALPFTLHLGDCIEVMRAMPDNSVDSIVTDPPYHLTAGKKGGSGPASNNPDSPAGRARIGTGFMGMAWDGGDIAQSVDMWREALRVLRPGGHLLAFSGSRTYHRMAVAIEDAGFEIRDQIMWVYGSGFPKSLDVSKAIDKAGGLPLRAQSTQWQGWGTALKPAHEPICMARKPLEGTVAANVLGWGTGALNIDGCRMGSEPVEQGRHGRSTELSGSITVSGGALRPTEHSTAAGRWPANLIHDGSAEVVALFPAEAGAAAQVHKRNGDKFKNSYGSFGGNIDEAGSTFQGDTGSAARFFYCPKASRRDRNEGTDNTHPTVKPTNLMAYLCRLVTPPGGTVFDPFTGSGSTGKACMREGFRFIGAELSPEYLDIARARIGHEHARVAASEPQQPPAPQMDLFAASTTGAQ